MSGPARQRSLRDRLHGIGLSWQSKKSESYAAGPTQPYVVPKNKSQSVDTHGYSNPLEAVPSRETDLAEDTTSSSAAALLGQSSNEADTKPKSPLDGDRSLSPERTSPTEKKSSVKTITQPSNTEEYVVKASDTLAGIAARFDTTPSELAKLNRLSSRLIFPGQSLYVPCKKSASSSTAAAPGSPTDLAVTEEQEVCNKSADVPLQSEKKESEKLPSAPTTPVADKIDGTKQSTDANKDTNGVSPSRDLDKECLERFLKINARYITDGQGIVSGVLLVTPNALMFDPNVSDPLVIEHGADSYGVVAPMEMIFRAAMYTDIARMKVKHAPDVAANAPKADVYYGHKGQLSQSQSEEERQSDTASKKPSSTLSEEKPKLVPNSQNGTALQNGTIKSETKEQSSDKPKEGKEETSPKQVPSGRGSIPEELEGIFASEGNEEGQMSRQGSRRERMMKRLSYPVESISSYTQSSISKIFSTSPKNLVDFSGGVFVRSANEDGKAEGEKEAPPETAAEAPKEGASDLPVYKNMVDEKYDILATVDKIIPRPARSCDDPPLYLCLRMGRPVNKKVHLSSPVLSYGKKRLQKEYWFSIPRDRADDLYIFFERWTPDVYGDVEEIKPEDRGFEPIETDEENEEAAEGEEGPLEEVSDGDKTSHRKGKRRGPFALLHLMGASQFINVPAAESPSDWEVVSKFTPESEVVELPVPELSEASEILNDQHRKDLCKNLPARAEGYPWTLLYSTSKHGFSLKTLYREMLKYETPVIMVILDTEGTVFGALASGSLRVSEHFYGTGETYLFTFKPDFKCFRWTGENMYFIKGNTNSIVIGAGDGQFGLWLDEDLYHGRSHQCKTFHNETLSSQEDFVVKALEVWGFV